MVYLDSGIGKGSVLGPMCFKTTLVDISVLAKRTVTLSLSLSSLVTLRTYSRKAKMSLVMSSSSTSHQPDCPESRQVRSYFPPERQDKDKRSPSRKSARGGEDQNTGNSGWLHIPIHVQAGNGECPTETSKAGKDLPLSDQEACDRGPHHVHHQLLYRDLGREHRCAAQCQSST